MSHRLAGGFRRTSLGLGLLLVAGCGDAPSSGSADAFVSSAQASTITGRAPSSKPLRARSSSRARKLCPADFLDPKYGK